MGSARVCPYKVTYFLLAFNKYFGGENIHYDFFLIVQFNVDFIMFQIWPAGAP